MGRAATARWHYWSTHCRLLIGRWLAYQLNRCCRAASVRQLSKDSRTLYSWQLIRELNWLFIVYWCHLCGFVDLFG